jgi:hypothetical protein
MAESSEQKRTRFSGPLASITLVLVGLLAASALAATVTQAPTISGDPSVGSTLTTSAGAWTPSSAKTEYTWLRCDTAGASCQGITGACGRDYVVRKGDDGHTLRARLTASDSDGTGASSLDSDPTAVVTSTVYSIPPDETDTCVKVTPTGPGQGTFNSGTQTGAGTTPVPGTTLKFIHPFPVVRISGRFKGKKTTLTRVTVRTPRGTRIRVNCKGRGCSFKRRAVAVRLVSLRSLKRTYRPKAQIEIRVTQADRIGKYTRIRTRRGKAPLRLDRCVMPGKTKPVRCPAG